MTALASLQLIESKQTMQSTVPQSAVLSLSLTRFRNYQQLRLTLPAAGAVALIGTNGAGKTNILEAVSLLTPGKGIRHARVAEIDAQAHGISTGVWAIASVVQTHMGEVMLSTGRDAQAQEDKRVVMIDGKRVRGQGDLAPYLSALWLTPQLDQLLYEGNSARRRFLDRLVYGFESTHASRVLAYETSMSERNRLLKQGRMEDAWCSALEHTMAEKAVAIAAARIESLARIQQAMPEAAQEFPHAHMVLHGVAEDALQDGVSALDVEQLLRDMWRVQRREDGLSGRTQSGPHRAQWEVWHPAKQMESAQCSTGEQKALLLAVILAQAFACRMLTGRAPILLLDEVVAHLDGKRRAALFDALMKIGCQVWLTGTDAAQFSYLNGQAAFFHVENGSVRPF